MFDLVLNMILLSFYGYGSTVSMLQRSQFTFYHSVPRSCWYLFNRPWKDGKMIWPCSHPVVLNPGLLDCETSTLTTTIIGKIYVRSNCKNKHCRDVCFLWIASHLKFCNGCFRQVISHLRDKKSGCWLR